ncbi:MAG: hypothetical protein NTZ39_01155 [Methanoregula sp.]|nr:hypothetical protein [Methanoregula sp.]
MDRSVKIFTVLIAILCISIFCTGCTNNSATANTTTSITTQPTTVASKALYTAGDVVKSSSGAAGTGWLILNYDPAADTYSRALIYQNPDGTWGYRLNTNTETSTRTVMEKVYTTKITHVSVPSVPVKTATAVSTTSPVTISTVGGSVTTSATTVTTTTPTGKPLFKSMAPDSADAGTQVSITDLMGSNFVTGTTVILAHTGSSNITATNVQVVSPSHITCTFTLPSTAAAGPWDVIITNPDGQSVKYNTYFTVHASTSVAATTTTSSTGTVVITMVDPSVVNGGWSASRQRLTIYTSTDVQLGATVKLVNGLKPDITAVDVYPQSSTSLLVAFDIPAGSIGQWDVVITNPDGTIGTLPNGLTIN